jgi:hypothetical protein
MRQSRTKEVTRGEPRRTIRVSDDLWLTAVAVAEARGESLSEVLREALRRYVGRVK